MKNYLIYFLTILAVTACFFDEKNPPAQPAPFDAKPLATRLVSEEANELGLVAKRVYEHTVCLFDKATLQPRMAQTYQIPQGGKIITTAPADKDGCVAFSTTSVFEPLAPENRLRTEFELRAHDGKITIPLAISPWLESNSGIFDLRTQPKLETLTDSQTAAALAGQGEFHPSQHLLGRPSNLQIEQIEAEPMQEVNIKGGAGFQFSVTFSGVATREKLDHSLQRLNLKQGTTQVQLRLLEKRRGNTKAIPLSPTSVLDHVTWNDGKLSIPKWDATLLHAPEKTSEILLAYKIEPIWGSALLVAQGTKNIDLQLRRKSSGKPELEMGWDSDLRLLSSAVASHPSPSGARGSEAAAFSNLQISSPITALLVDSKTNDQGLATYREFAFRICLFDRIGSRAREGEKFTVRLNGKEFVTDAADKDGCLYVNRPYEFSPGAPENDLEEVLEVMSAGGNAQMTLLVNPWANDNHVVLDRRNAKNVKSVPFEKVEQALKGKGIYEASLHLKPDHSNLAATGLQAKYLRKGNTKKGLWLEYDLAFSLTALRKKIDGSKRNLELKGGKAKLELALLERKTGESRPTLLSEIYRPKELDIRADGTLTSTTSFALRRIPNPLSEILLAYRIETEGFLATQGQFSFDLLSAKASAKPTVEFPWSASSFPADIEENKSEVTDYGSFNISDYDVEFAPGKATYDRSSWQGSRTLRFRVRLDEALGNVRIGARKGTFFQVAVRRKSETRPAAFRDVSLDENGWLIWTEDFEFPYAQAETFENFELVIRGTESPYLTSPPSLPFALNLAAGDKANLFWDSQRLNQAPPQNRNAARLETRLEPKVIYASSAPEYLLDRHLNLTTIKHYKLSLFPQFFRAFEFKEGGENILKVQSDTRFQIRTALVRGKTLKRASITREDEKAYADGYIAGYDVETKSKLEGKESRLEIDLALPIPTLEIPTLLQYRTRLIIQVTPLGKNAPAGRTLSFDFNLAPDREEIRNQANDVEIAHVHPESLARERRLNVDSKNFPGTAYSLKPALEDLNPYDFFVAERSQWGDILEVEATFGAPVNPKHLNLSQLRERFSKLTQAQTEELTRALAAEKSVGLARALKNLGWLCRNFSPAPTGLKGLFNDADEIRCQKNPEDFFQVSAFTLVDEIAPEKPRGEATRVDSIFLTSSFIGDVSLRKNDTDADRWVTEFALGLSGNMGYDTLANGGRVHWGVNGQEEHFHVVETAISRQFTDRESTAITSELIGEKKEIRFRAATRNCLFVQPLEIVQTIAKTESVLLCTTPVPTPNDLTETWYALRENARSPSLVLKDPKAPEEHDWHLLVRGTNQYRNLEKILADKTKARVFELKKVIPYRDGTDSVNEFKGKDPRWTARGRADGGIFPGVLDYHEISGLKWTESELYQQAKIISDTQIGYLTKPESKTNPKVLREIGRFSRCIVEKIARRYDYDAFFRTSARERILGDLKNEGGEALCLKFARAERGIKP